MIFLDNASTTKINPESSAVMNDINASFFYNPSSLYTPAVTVKGKVQAARESLLKQLGGNFTDTLVFTSCATESNNYAIFGRARKQAGKFLFSSTEHPSVYNAALFLQNTGHTVEFIKSNPNGTVNEEDFIKKLPGADFVSIIHVNNETGVINNIQKLSRIAKEINKNIIFHSDGVQAFGKIAVNVLSLGVDLYTLSSHKIHGPKGVGALYIKRGVVLKPLLIGGGQENGQRGGTENTAGICAFAKAAEQAQLKLAENTKHVKLLGTTLLEELKGIENICFIESESPYIITFALLGTKPETILHMLESKGILVGSGSACSGKTEESRILKAMGCSKEVASSAIRVSFSPNNTLQEIETAAQAIKEVNSQYLSTIHSFSSKTKKHKK